ncbi:hypothetical protein [uncultured Tateyamaria sp.]|uniref:hypothetical protein n=1 Tax=uncultured Tateyamaria sp. TaxID=455651 RepID=UPI002607B59D|nr:hypothetical protein [uncultured Tateyamaria sp.]
MLTSQIVKRALMLAMLSSAPATAGTVGGTGGALEVTQWANRLQLQQITLLEGQSLARMAQVLSANLEQVRTLMRTHETIMYNTQGLPDEFKDEITDTVVQMRRTLEEAGAVARDGQALDRFLRSGAVTADAYDPTALENAQLTERYDEWLDTWNGTLESGLRQAGLTFEDVESDAALIDAIQGRIGNEQGQMQALQVANELAGTMSRQLVDLRMLTASQLQQNSVAWGRVLGEQDNQEITRRESEQEIKQTIENLEQQRGTGRSIQDILGLRP